MNKLNSKERDKYQRTAESIKQYHDKMMKSTLNKLNPKKFDLNLNKVE